MCSIGALDAQARWSTSQRTRCRLSSSSTRTGTRRGQARQNCVRRKTSSTSRWPCEARQKVVRRKLVLWSSDSYDLLNTIWSLMYTFWFLCASSGSYGIVHHPCVKVVIGPHHDRLPVGLDGAAELVPQPAAEGSDLNLVEQEWEASFWFLCIGALCGVVGRGAWQLRLLWL